MQKGNGGAARVRTLRLTSVGQEHVGFLQGLMAEQSTVSTGTMKGEPGCVRQLLAADRLHDLREDQRLGLESIVAAVRDEIGRALCLDLRVVRHALLLYTRNGRHHMHSDYPDVRNDYSASVNLSQGSEGGRLVFYRPHTRVTKSRQWRWHLQRHMRAPYTPDDVGSHRQYDANVFDARTLHEVEPVLGGERFVLTLWMTCGGE